MIETVSETGSTNADLLARVSGGEQVAEGDWLVADRQSAGRGRQGRTWFDGSGNFMGSTAVRITPQDPPAASLALVTGLAVYEAVVQALPDPARLQLKWPNDLLLSGAKLAGVLLERTGDTIVIGIGVNLVAAPELPDRETIALGQIGMAPDRDIFAANLARCFAAELERWRLYGLDSLVSRWTSAAHPLGTPLTVSPPGDSVISGKFGGLDSSGALLLRLADGSARVIHAGDVMLADGGN